MSWHADYECDLRDAMRGHDADELDEPQVETRVFFDVGRGGPGVDAEVTGWLHRTGVAIDEAADTPRSVVYEGWVLRKNKRNAQRGRDVRARRAQARREVWEYLLGRR